MIVFHKLRWKNFLSTGSAWTEIVLDANSNTLIVGKNGAGKSTILEALCFVLFGSPFRKINKPNLVNSINGKDCVVEVEFTTGSKRYKIIRGIKPNIFEVYCNDELLDQTGSGEYQDYLERYILRMNKKSFVQIVILGAQSFTPFMQLKAADRREIIEDLLDIGIFSTMNLIAKQKLSANKDNIEKSRIELRGLEDKKAYIEKTLATIKADNEAKLLQSLDEKNKMEENIGKLTGFLDIFENQRQELKKKIGPVTKLREKHRKLIALQAGIETNLKRHQKDVAFYHDNTNCPTCHQIIDDAFRSSITTETEQEIIKYSDGLDSISIEISNLVTLINEADRLTEELNNLNQKISACESEIYNRERELDKLRTVALTNNLALDAENKAELKVTVKQITVIENKIDMWTDERAYLELVVSLLKDGGIKTKIIKKYLPIINKQINKYLSDMDFFVNFNIDENFEEKILSRHRDSFQYDNFSNGEKMRIDLSILFTWRAIARMRNSVNTNLLILDEVFDSSLDDAGVDEFIKIIQGLTGDQNVFIISHKGELLYEKFDNVIKFQKDKGFSGVVT